MQSLKSLWDREFCLPLGLAEVRRKKLASSLAMILLVSFLLVSKICLVNWPWDFIKAIDPILIRLHLLATGLYLLFFMKCTPRQGLIIALVALPLLIKIAFFEAGKIYIHDFLLILVCRNIDTTKLARWQLFILSALFLVASSLYSLGIISNSGDGARGEKIRPAFGFFHPNPAGLVVSLVCICLILSYWGRLRWWHCALSGLGIFFNVFVTNSRGAALLLILFLFFSTVFYYRPSILRNPYIQAAAMSMPLIMMAASLVLGFLYDPNNALFVFLNRLSSLRLEFLSELFHSVSPALFREVRIPQGIIMDNSYASSLYYNGICVTAVYLLGQCVLMCRLVKKGAVPETAIALSFLIHGFLENVLFNFSLNPAYWLLGSVLFALPIEEQQLLCRGSHKVTSGTA